MSDYTRARLWPWVTAVAGGFGTVAVIGIVSWLAGDRLSGIHALLFGIGGVVLTIALWRQGASS